MQLHFAATTWPNTPSLGALSGQKDGHPQTQGRSRAAAGPRPEAGRLSFLDPWGGGRGTQATAAPPTMGSGSTAPEQENRGQGSDEAQEQGSSVPCWAHQASINRLVPTVPIERSPLGTSTLGRRGGANLRVGHAWMTRGPGPSPTALLTHVWLVMTTDHFN